MRAVDLTGAIEVRRWTRSFYQQVKKQSRHADRLDGVDLHENLCWTVALEDEKEYNLVGPDEATTARWISTLDHIIANIRAVQQENEYYL